MIRSAVFAALLVCFAVPAAAYDEFPSSATAKERFAWGQKAYPYYCNAPPPPELRNIRFEDLNFFARGALGWASKQQIADYIQDNCGKEETVATTYVGN